MNQNSKDKCARLDIRLRPNDKEKIKRLANKCNLPLGEYVVQRALGYEPRTVLPDVFFNFYNKLCQLCNSEKTTPEAESKLLELIDEIHSELLLPRKENVKWLQQDSGP